MEQENRQMVYNAIQTPDGTIIESFHRHDYKTHLDKNGKEYMIDGGLSYCRCSTHPDQKHIIVYFDESFDKVRDHFRWGKNYDKDMNLLPETQWTKLSELNNDHLTTLIDGGYGAEWCQRLFEQEKKYRKL
jgi:hypothetical protein